MRFFLTMSLFLVTGLAQADVTIGASGANVTTFANALATATATPNSTIRFIDNSVTAEAGTVGVVNSSLTITGPGCTWGNTSGSPTLAINANLLSPLVIKNIKLTHNTANGNTIQWSGVGVGSSVRFDNAYVENTLSGTGGAFLCSGILAATNQLVATDSYFMVPNHTSTGPAFRNSGACITANTILLKNCLMKGNGSSSIGFLNTSTHVASVATLQYCDIIGFGTGFSSTCVNTVTDCIFSGNTTDQALTAPASTSDFSYIARTTSIASPGTGSITITAARTFCDTNNYWISHASLTMGAGTSIVGVTGVDIGLNGIQQGPILGMGCMTYGLAFCGGYGAGK